MHVSGAQKGAIGREHGSRYVSPEKLLDTLKYSASTWGSDATKKVIRVPRATLTDPDSTTSGRANRPKICVLTHVRIDGGTDV